MTTPSQVQSRWIQWQNPRVFWRRLVSTRERRLFTIAFGNTVTVVHPTLRLPAKFAFGFLIRLFRWVDGVAYLNMLPQTVEFEWDQLVSQDGVPLRARLGAVLQVRDNFGAPPMVTGSDTATEFLMKSVCLDPIGQERMFRDRVVVALQRTCVKWSYSEISKNLHGLADDVVALMRSSMSSDDPAPFILKQLIVYELAATNEQLAQSALEIARLKAATAVAVEEKNFRVAEANAAVAGSVIEAKAEKDRQFAVAEFKEEFARIAKDEAGRWVLFPGATHSLEMAKVESDREREKSVADRWTAVTTAALQGAENAAERKKIYEVAAFGPEQSSEPPKLAPGKSHNTLTPPSEPPKSH